MESKIQKKVFFYPTICYVCNRFGEGINIMRCSKCKMISYCSQAHQRENWKDHKPFCKAVQEVLKEQSVNRNIPSKYLLIMKQKWSQLVSQKLGRPLELYEKEMFMFPRECAICYQPKFESLEDCQKCAVSFCKNHKDGIEHRNACNSLKLYLDINLLFMSTNYEDEILDEHYYLQHISKVETFENIQDFINISGNIQADSVISYNVLTALHSDHFTRSLTMFHAIGLLNYVPEREDLVIHVYANIADEVVYMEWHILLHLMKKITSLVVIMVGPELKCESTFDMFSKYKKLSLKFHRMLYPDYVYSSLFVKPDLIVRFNGCIISHEITYTDEMWASFIQIIGKQNCPFVLTFHRQVFFKQIMSKIDTILNRKVRNVYSGQNLFASLKPYREIGPELVSYFNNYLSVYATLCS